MIMIICICAYSISHKKSHFSLTILMLECFFRFRCVERWEPWTVSFDQGLFILWTHVGYVWMHVRQWRLGARKSFSKHTGVIALQHLYLLFHRNQRWTFTQ